MTLAIVLLGVGLALIVAEIFLPSFGILSVLAGLAILAALWFAFQVNLRTGFWFFVVTALSVPVTIGFAFGLLPKTPLGRRLILARESRGVEAGGLEERLGEEGVAETDLRPGGFARVGGRRVDVVTRGEYLEAGARVRVIEATARRLVVAAAPDSTESEATT